MTEETAERHRRLSAVKAKFVLGHGAGARTAAVPKSDSQQLTDDWLPQLSGAPREDEGALVSSDLRERFPAWAETGHALPGRRGYLLRRLLAGVDLFALL